MKYKIPHKTYAILLLVSVLITACAFFIQNNASNAIVASLGAGGIASVCVAWLIDARNTKIRTIENKEKAQELMKHFVRIYRRLLWETANECYGFCCKDELHSFQEWLLMLKTLEPRCPKDGQKSMKTRCTRISASIENLQRQIEIFRSQSATLVYAEFPNVEQSIEALDNIWVHCWGTLKQLETENYKVFCETTYILYTDFITAFPQHKDDLPDKYSVNSLKL